MSVHSRPSIQYQDGMELRDRKMTKDCTQPLRIGNIRALNGCLIHNLHNGHIKCTQLYKIHIAIHVFCFKDCQNWSWAEMVMGRNDQ